MVINESLQEIANKTVEATASVSKDLTGQAWSYLLDQLKPFTTVFKTVGVIVLIYVIYRIWRGIVSIKDRNRLKNIEQRLDEIDDKLDRLLGKRSSDKLSKDKKK